jgi:hypothetical protein
MEAAGQTKRIKKGGGRGLKITKHVTPLRISIGFCSSLLMKGQAA